MLRRAMGKKKPEEMAKQGEIFRKGALERGVDEKVATYIFDLMEKFAGYGFNKSHSAAYALLSFQTAWLKTHYPAYFMAAVLSADMDNTDKVVTLIDECRRMGLEVIPPDINKSNYAFTTIDAQTIVYGLGAIKGVGEGAIEGLIEDRNKNGTFSGLADFCQRLETGKLNRRTLEAMIKAGALDSLGPNRASLMAGVPEALKIADQFQRDLNTGQDDLFGDVVAAETVEAVIPNQPDWEEEYRLASEKETLGLYLTGHPITRYEDELKAVTGQKLGELVMDKPDPDAGYRQSRKEVLVSGLIIGIRVRKNNDGRKWAVVTLDDKSGRVDVLLFADVFETYQHLLDADRLLIVKGMMSYDERNDGISVRAQECFDIDQARAQFARRLILSVTHEQTQNGLIQNLQKILGPHRDGKCDVFVKFRGSSADAVLRMGEDWKIRPSDELMHRLGGLLGKEQVRLSYD